MKRIDDLQNMIDKNNRLNKENTSLRASLAQEKAASAELRSALETIKDIVWHQHGPIANEAWGVTVKALSSDAGKSLLEEVERLREENSRMQRELEKHSLREFYLPDDIMLRIHESEG
jgi:regulator of replication initiation timing